MIGALHPAASSRFLISGTAAAASGTFTVHRTISEPASASSIVCLNVASTSAVSVFVIDCTTIGAPPPTFTWPTFTPYVFRRGCSAPVASNPLIWVSIITSILADRSEIALAWPADACTDAFLCAIPALCGTPLSHDPIRFAECARRSDRSRKGLVRAGHDPHVSADGARQKSDVPRKARLSGQQRRRLSATFLRSSRDRAGSALLASSAHRK